VFYQQLVQQHLDSKYAGYGKKSETFFGYQQPVFLR